MNKKKGILLFEVAFAGLLASIISIFIFRAYGIFLKSSKKSLEYSKLIAFTEKKVWDIQMNKNVSKMLMDRDQENEKNNYSFIWHLDLDNTDYVNLKKGILTVMKSDKSKIVYDSVLFLKVQEK